MTHEVDESHVAFVRAVMVGRDGLARELLVEAFERSGGRDVRSHLTTGNVSFRAWPNEAAGVAAAAREVIEEIVGRPTEIYVRPAQSLERMRRTDPFRGPANSAMQSEPQKLMRCGCPVVDDGARCGFEPGGFAPEGPRAEKGVRPASDARTYPLTPLWMRRSAKTLSGS